MGPGFRRGDSGLSFSSEGPSVQRGWDPGAKFAEQPRIEPGAGSYAWVRNSNLDFFESEEQPHVKEVNGRFFGASGFGQRAVPFGVVGYTMSKIDRRGFRLRRTASGGAESGKNIVRTIDRKVQQKSGSERWAVGR